MKLMLRRARYQIVPVLTMLLSTALVIWLWSRHARSSVAVGEVNAIHVNVESKVEAVLEELPRPVQLFDTVSKGQVIARLDLTLVEKQLERLRSEVESIKTRNVGPAGATQPASQLVAERESLMAELQAKLDARDIKSPINGAVMEILRRPGQSAELGKPIMTIAANDGDFIIGYLREDQPIRPVNGALVTVRTRSGTAAPRTYESYVMSVGPQVMPLPARHLRRADFPEWATRVQIARPAESDLTPGQVVDLVFHPKPQ
jgi:multidrug resistance efflux pump